MVTSVVSSPDPTPNRRRGAGACFLGLADLAYLNSVAPIRVAPCICGLYVISYHVILHYSQLLLLVRVVDALLCQNDALS